LGLLSAPALGQHAWSVSDSRKSFDLPPTAGPEVEIQNNSTTHPVTVKVQGGADVSIPAGQKKKVTRVGTGTISIVRDGGDASGTWDTVL
jgi:hypothetical protein